MTTPSDRETAAALAQRIRNSRIDPAAADEAGLPPGDRPPGYAEALMSEAPAALEPDGLSSADWELIAAALEHYARGG